MNGRNIVRFDGIRTIGDIYTVRTVSGYLIDKTNEIESGAHSMAMQSLAYAKKYPIVGSIVHLKIIFCMRVMCRYYIFFMAI